MFVHKISGSQLVVIKFPLITTRVHVIDDNEETDDWRVEDDFDFQAQ